jgi:PDZ domain-containing protein
MAEREPPWGPGVGEFEALEPAPFDPERFEAGFPAQRRRASRWLALVPVLALALILGLVDVPYFLLSPGPTEDVVPLIHIEGGGDFPSGDHMFLVAVSFQRPNVYQALFGWVSPTHAVDPERAYVFPGQTDQQERQAAFSQMDTSKINAAIVALTAYAGYPKEHGDGVLVEQVGQGFPADGRLVAGDVITAVGATPATSVAQVGSLIRAAGVGHALRFTVKANVGTGATRSVSIAPVRVRGADHALIGVQLVPNFPFAITIDSGNIGGPSAGLMWTLGLADLLTPGDLTRGAFVAGTGEIAPDGRVLPIGGIEEKVAAVERAAAAAGVGTRSGDAIFFVPADEANAAQAVAHHLTIVPVRTFEDALDYLDQHTASATGG